MVFDVGNIFFAFTMDSTRRLKLAKNISKYISRNLLSVFKATH